MVNFRVIDLDNPTDTINCAVIDRTWDYFSLATGLPDSVVLDSIIDSEFYYDSTQFDYFNIIDTVQGSWTDFGFTGSPFGSDYALKVQFSMPGYFSYSDRIILLEDIGDTTIITWNVTPGQDNIPYQHSPGLGDTLKLYTTKPFSSQDVYEFVSKGASYDEKKLDQLFYTWHKSLSLVFL